MKEEGIKIFLKRVFHYIVGQKLGFVILPYALFRIKRFATKQKQIDLHALLSFSFESYIAGLIKPMQVREEIYMNYYLYCSK